MTVLIWLIYELTALYVAVSSFIKGNLIKRLHLLLNNLQRY